jgi:hypothetical protein
MSAPVILAISLLPLLTVLAMAIVFRSTFDNLKLLAIALPLQAFGAVEAGFTIPPYYIILVIIIFSLLIKGELLSAGHPGCKPVIAFLVLAIVVTVIAAWGPPPETVDFDRTMAARAGPWRSPLQLALIIFHLSLFFVVINAVKSQGDADKILKIHLRMGLLVMILGLFQIVAFAFKLPLQDYTWSVNLADSAALRYGEVRLYGAGVTNFSARATFGESLHFANYLISIVPVAIALWAFSLKEIRIKFGILASPLMAVLGVTTLFFTMSRSGWIAFAISLVVLALWLSPRIIFIHVPVVFAVVTAVAALFAEVGFFSESTDTLWSIIVSRLNIYDIITDPRMRYFEVLWESFTQHPILGLGAGNFALMAPAVTGSDMLHSAHGILWAALADFGILGFGTLGIFFVSVLVRLGRAIRVAKPSTAQAVMIGLFASLVGLMFQDLFLGDRPTFHLVLLLGLATAYTSISDNNIGTPCRNKDFIGEH